MNYAEIKHFDIADGVGVRTSLFVSGCRIHCPGCFNGVAQDFSYGKTYTREVEDAIVESLRPSYVAGLTLLGGDPMEPENQAVIVGLAERVCLELPEKTIWCFTGYVYDRDLVAGGSRHTGVTDRLLSCVDVLVDGPFVQELHDITLRFRGSSNQRLIDVPATLESGSVTLWHDDPVFETRGM